MHRDVIVRDSSRDGEASILLTALTARLLWVLVLALSQIGATGGSPAFAALALADPLPMS
jgi:hypothetical protein